MMTSLAQAYSPHPGGGIHVARYPAPPIPLPPGLRGHPSQDTYRQFPSISHNFPPQTHTYPPLPLPPPPHSSLLPPPTPLGAGVARVSQAKTSGPGSISAPALPLLRNETTRSKRMIIPERVVNGGSKIMKARRGQLLQKRAATADSQHALPHLNPIQAQQAQLFQQQQQQMIQQQRQQQAARQAILAQQYSGQLPIAMQNGMNQMAQFNAMRAGPIARPVNLPQHLQQQQQAHAQAQAQAQHQQIMMAQQVATQQQANDPGQGGHNRQEKVRLRDPDFLQFRREMRGEELQPMESRSSTRSISRRRDPDSDDDRNTFNSRESGSGGHRNVQRYRAAPSRVEPIEDERRSSRTTLIEVGNRQNAQGSPYGSPMEKSQSNESTYSTENFPGYGNLTAIGSKPWTSHAEMQILTDQPNYPLQQSQSAQQLQTKSFPPINYRPWELLPTQAGSYGSADESSTPAVEIAPRQEYYRVYTDEPRPPAEAFEYIRVSDPQGDYMLRRPVCREPEGKGCKLFMKATISQDMTTSEGSRVRGLLCAVEDRRLRLLTR